ncbi:porin [Paraburkholderia sp. J12]|uniref:porin n=1 Tax=Paraburkholderia sp. J12 TaxID=2805432 RepID=UPI002ABE12D2|nr:porin [Paraburkholderia sp. J12]
MKQRRKRGWQACVWVSMCLAGVVHAQSVTLYGTLDTGVEYINHANAAGQSMVRVPSNTGEFPSNFGLQGNEPLGSGYKAIFKLESGINVGTGSSTQVGRLFGRQAWVGISTPYGDLTFGRQYSMIVWAIDSSDMIGPSLYSIASLDPYIATSRADNTVEWRGRFGDFTAGASWSFGRDGSPAGASNTPGQGNCAGNLPGDPAACRDWSAMLKYQSAYGGGAVVYEQQNGGPGAAINLFNGLAPLGFAASGDHDSRLIVAANTTLGSLRLAALWLNRHVDFAQPAQAGGVTTNQYVLEAGYQVTPYFNVDGLAQRIVNSQQDTRATMEALRGTYFLSKRTSAYAQFGWLQNSRNGAYSVSGGGLATPGKGMNQVGAMVGMRHTF